MDEAKVTGFPALQIKIRTNWKRSYLSLFFLLPEKSLTFFSIAHEIIGFNTKCSYVETENKRTGCFVVF